MAQDLGHFLRPLISTTVKFTANRAYARFFVTASRRCNRHESSADSDHGKRITLLGHHVGLEACYPRIGTLGSSQSLIGTPIGDLHKRASQIEESGATDWDTRTVVAGMQLRHRITTSTEDVR